MTWVDYVVLFVLGLSLVMSVWRGAVRELFSLLGWVLAYFASIYYAATVAEHLPSAIADPRLRMLAAYVAIFAGVALTSTVLGITLSGLLKLIGLGAFDRLLGVVVGLLRGLLIVLVLTLGAGMTSVPHSAAWRNSTFSPLCEAAGVAIKPLLPAKLAQHIRYE